MGVALGWGGAKGLRKELGYYRDSAFNDVCTELERKRRQPAANRMKGKRGPGGSSRPGGQGGSSGPGGPGGSSSNDDSFRYPHIK